MAFVWEGASLLSMERPKTWWIYALIVLAWVLFAAMIAYVGFFAWYYSGGYTG